MRRDNKNKDIISGYKDRFFIPNETEKTEILDTNFKDDFKNLPQDVILNAYVELGQMVIFISKDDVCRFLQKLKDIGYEILSELSGIDLMNKRGGIEVFYQLLNINSAKRVRVKTFVKNGEFLKSVSSIFKSANWAERELYDMMGVFIENHPNLKRILMPDDWHGHPLLKSYPLHGDEFAQWYEVDKIFGKDKREAIGPENRDSGLINSKDTFNFSRIYHETEFGAEEPTKEFLQEYQEDKLPIVKKISRKEFITIKKRK